MLGPSFAFPLNPQHADKRPPRPPPAEKNDRSSTQEIRGAIARPAFRHCPPLPPQARQSDRRAWAAASSSSTLRAPSSPLSPPSPNVPGALTSSRAPVTPPSAAASSRAPAPARGADPRRAASDGGLFDSAVGALPVDAADPTPRIPRTLARTVLARSSAGCLESPGMGPTGRSYIAGDRVEPQAVVELAMSEAAVPHRKVGRLSHALADCRSPVRPLGSSLGPRPVTRRNARGERLLASIVDQGYLGKSRLDWSRSVGCHLEPRTAS